ncbi:transposase [Kribbella sp. VKM Ac-2527]|uniref:Transposase n=1 Tax=Kribbella caucasensis TaxID=2512215 RepID=A0A4R6IYM8_9ACTN|nr:transposase [Kribbella sp. VKM Ac-2527]TDO27964.1 transposase [Kribbella sp. VKM Ac-2527]
MAFRLGRPRRHPGAARARAGRAGADVVGWLDGQTERFRQRIEVVAIDPCAAYRRAVTDTLPQAQVVVDHLNPVRLANAAVTAVRQRVTWDNRGRRGRTIDPEWTNRRRLLTARERLTHQRFQAMRNSCLDADPPGQILTAWIAKEEFRALLGTARTGGHRHDISHRLYRFYTWCANADIPEVTRLAQTIEDWWPEIEAFCKTGITNAKTEGTNRLIKDVARRLQVPQPRQPTPTSMVLLHSAITPEHSQPRDDARLNSKSRYEPPWQSIQ